MDPCHVCFAAFVGTFPRRCGRADCPVPPVTGIYECLAADDLTQDEIAALLAYAAKHGRTWKATLRRAWMGGPPYDDTGILRRLRNTRGPSWLDRYRLPQPKNGEPQ